MTTDDTELPPQRLLDVREVARFLHIPYRSVYVLIERGELGHYRVGRRLRFRTDDLSEYLRRCRTEQM